MPQVRGKDSRKEEAQPGTLTLGLPFHSEASKAQEVDEAGVCQGSWLSCGSLMVRFTDLHAETSTPPRTIQEPGAARAPTFSIRWE